MRWRVVEVTRGLFGLALLVAPRPMLRHVHRLQIDSKTLVVARVLGVRQLTQAVLSGSKPSPEVLAVGVWVDGAHAASALALVALDPDRAFAGTLNAATSLAWAGWGHADLVGASVVGQSPDGARDLLASWVLARLPGGGSLLEGAAGRGSRPT